MGFKVKKKLKNIISKMPAYEWLKMERDRIQYRQEEKEKKQNYDELRYIVPEGEKAPFVSIIILNRDGRDKLEVLMKSLYEHRFYGQYEIILVDNASQDDSVLYMEQWKEKLDITIVKNKDNKTFSEGNNIGVKSAKGDYLLFLNNDTEVTDGWLDALLQVAVKDEQVGAVGARLVYPKIPKKNEKANKSYKIQHAGIGFRDKIREKQYFIQPYNKGNGRSNYGPKNGAVEMACVTAAVLMVSRKKFEEIGGFDEKYVYGYEDVDFCLQLLKAGYHNYYCADCLVYHHEFGTQSLDDSKEVKDRRHHNMEVFKGKWQRFLARKILKEKLDGAHLFTESKLTIGFIKSDEEEASFEVKDYIDELKKKGYSVKNIEWKEKEQQYKVGIDVDVLISCNPNYDITQITGAKNGLIVSAWVLDNRKEWEQKDYYDKLDCVLILEKKNTITENILKFIQMLYEYNDDVVEDRTIDICGAMPDNDTTKFWGDYHYAVALKKEFEKRGYHANILSREHWYDRSSAKYTIVLRGVKPYYKSVETGRKYILWNISHPEDVALNEYELFDYVFFASQYMKDTMASKIPVKSGVLLQCTSPEVMISKDDTEKKYELLFVGNSKKIFRPILKDLLPTKYNLTVYGRQWENFPVQEYVVQDYLDNAKVGQAYHDAKILLNDHWDDMREYGIISNRIFDALAAGAFIISDDVKGLEEILQDTVVTYKNREDLNRKIDYYLKHPKEREEKAKKGQKIVLEKHTFANRVEQLIAVMETL